MIAARLLRLVEPLTRLLLGTASEFGRPALGIRYEIGGTLLSGLHNLGLGKTGLQLLPGLSQELLRLITGFAKDLVALFDDLTGVVDFARDGDTHAVDDVGQLASVDDDAATDRQPAGLGEELFQAVNEVQYVQEGL
ncbi:MAG TPA: hypothetical protein VIW01_05825 [Dehalococcoidia bacterium]